MVISDDPGALPNIRISGETQNNVNRQIRSSAAGLAHCDRRFAVKLRTDSRLSSLGFLDLYAAYQSAGEPQRLVVPMLFTLDPTMFEQVPMHVSDWFQFGDAAALRAYWECPFMTHEEAVWYDVHPYADHSTHLDRRFNCLFAVEQHIARHYASRMGLAVPRFHNDIAEVVMAAHRVLLSRHFIIASLEQLGLEFPKYAWADRSDFQKLNCVDFFDWLDLAASETGFVFSQQQYSLIAARRKQKAFARRLYRMAKPLWPLLSKPALKNVINFGFRKLISPGR